MQTVLGWNMNFSIWVGAATVALYVMLGGLRSAIINEVLQFVLIWAGAALIPILGLIEAGGWTSSRPTSPSTCGNTNYTHLWSTLGHFKDNPMGINWVGIVFGLGAIISFRLLDDRLPRRAARPQREQSARGQDGSGDSVRPSRWRCRLSSSSPACCVGLLRDSHASTDSSCPAKYQGQPSAPHSYDQVLPLMLIRYCGPGLLGPGHHGAGRRLHERHGRQRLAPSRPSGPTTSTART